MPPALDPGAVTNPYTRHPALLGMASATLDRLCGGRFILSLSRSERFVIQDRLGLPYRQPRATLADTVAVLRRLLAGDQVTTSGGHSTLHNVRLAIQPVQHPLPIYLAVIGPQALHLAGAIADGVVLNAYVPSACVRYAVAEIRQAAREAGRDPEAIAIIYMLVVRLTEDPAALWPGLKQRLVRLLAEPYVGELLLEKGGFDAGILPALRAAAAQGRETAAVGLISDAMVEAFYLAGSAARCRERIAEYRQALIHRCSSPGCTTFSRWPKPWAKGNPEHTHHALCALPERFAVGPVRDPEWLLGALDRLGRKGYRISCLRHHVACQLPKTFDCHKGLP